MFISKCGSKPNLRISVFLLLLVSQLHLLGPIVVNQVCLFTFLLAFTCCNSHIIIQNSSRISRHSHPSPDQWCSAKEPDASGQETEDIVGRMPKTIYSNMAFSNEHATTWTVPSALTITSSGEARPLMLGFCI